MDAIVVQPQGFVGEVIVRCHRDMVFVDLCAPFPNGPVYTLYDGKWVLSGMYDIDHGHSFRVAVPFYMWLWYRFQDWRDASSFRMTGKRSWWRSR